MAVNHSANTKLMGYIDLDMDNYEKFRRYITEVLKCLIKEF